MQMHLFTGDSTQLYEGDTASVPGVKAIVHCHTARMPAQIRATVRRTQALQQLRF